MGQRPITDGNGRDTNAEIIPPDRANKAARSGIWISVSKRDDGHHAFASSGPLAIILALLALGILLTAAFLFLLGTLLFWIPVLGMLVTVLFLSKLFRGYFRRGR